MDSRLLAGAYSQHFRSMEQENSLDDSDRIDSIERAKKLTLETNKRRKTQAQKRKIEAQREEKRRSEILTKRREEQKQATEKYQRSHIPPSARQQPGRRSPRRGFGGGVVLEDALRLIRGSPRHSRPGSARDRIISPRKENEDPFEKSYFENHRHHSAGHRPGSGKGGHQINTQARAQLMDHSLRNLTSSKTLFEQQLEQQQTLLFEQQQQSIRDFDNAVRQEIDSDLSKYDGVSEAEGNNPVHDDNNSCSSVDSLDDSYTKERINTGNWSGNVQLAKQSTTSKGSDFKSDLRTVEHLHQEACKNDYSTPIPEATHGTDSDNPNSNKGWYLPLNHDMTPSATYQLPVSLSEALAASNFPQLINQTWQGGENEMNQNYQTLKQFSTDSIGSGSSNLSAVSMTQNSCETKQAVPNNTISNTHLSSQIAWASPVPTCNASTTFNNITNNNNNNTGTWPNEYNPRYASAIGLKIWPGQGGSTSVNTTMSTNPSISSTPFSTASSTSTTSYGLNHPTPSTLSTGSDLSRTTSTTTSSYISRNDSVLKSGIVGNSMGYSNTNPSTALDITWHDLQYPQVQNMKNNKESQSNSVMMKNPPSQTNSSNLSNQSLQKQLPTPLSNVQTYSQIQGHPIRDCSGDGSQLYYQQQQQQQQPQQSKMNQNKFSAAPKPAVRTIYPSQRPPVPKATPTASVQTPSEKTSVIEKQVSSNVRNCQDDATKHLTEMEEKETAKENDFSNNETEDVPIIKGILKTGQDINRKEQTLSGIKQADFPRDSLELAHMQANKKPKKKSVHFPENYAEETLFEKNEPVSTKAMVITNSGIPVYKPPGAVLSSSRPMSAKATSSTQKTEMGGSKQTRAASAGTTRPTPTTHWSSGDDGQVTSNNTNNNNTQQANTSSPPQQAAVSSINRPKAAAHIIMSGHDHPNHKDGSTGVIAHQSHLDTKVKNINNTLLPCNSRGPVKVPSSASTVTVYHVANSEYGAAEQDDLSYWQVPGNSLNKTGESTSNGALYSGSTSTPIASGVDHQKQRLRDQAPSSKRVPISNTVVTRTSIVPASTKISVPQSNTGMPSYSSSAVNGNSNGGGNGITSGVVYDENGMRIDRTPTDEEISWLWDKVRNCLQKEESAGNGPNGGGSGGAPPRIQSGSVGEQGKQPPTLSMKLIDGAALGFGGNNNTVGAGLRTGAGFFQASPSPAVQSNKVRPAIQQQGSYLRRYGLLKQRRAVSATGSDRNPLQPQQVPQSLHRASSAVNLRQYQQNSGPPGATPTGPQMEAPPPLMSQAYVPQDGVSESTAAFIMAERLAKQSLTDSHIQSGMTDAQVKQEAHNMRSRLASHRGGHSALSIEEQNLLASLDKLNERLRVTDTHYSGTIHYHQPYQAHLSGFRVNPTNDNNRQRMLGSPRSQQGQGQRSQSARIRQQTRQYR